MLDVTFTDEIWDAGYDPNHPWTITDGQDLDYEKHPYEVRTKTGSVYVCWPNAGHFYNLDGHNTIEFEDVVAVRPGPYPWERACPGNKPRKAPFRN